MKRFVLQCIDIGRISAVLYTLCACLLFFYNSYARSLFNTIAYHHTHSEFWVMLWVLFPGILSGVLGILVYQWLRRRQRMSSGNHAWPLIQRFLRTYFVLFFIIFGAIVIYNKMSWGYFIARPRLHRSVRNAKTLLAITPVTTVSTDQGKTFALPSELNRFHHRENALYGRRDPYYGDTDRIFMAFEDRASRSPALEQWPDMYHDSASKLSPRQLQAIYTEIIQTGKLSRSQAGYPDGKELHGHLVEFIDSRERRWVYAGIGTAQISNDHYAFYECIFSLEGSSSQWIPEIKAYQKYFYDVAGLEGAEFTMFPLFGLAGLLVSGGIAFGGTGVRFALKTIRSYL
jgi:hypothetical protein